MSTPESSAPKKDARPRIEHEQGLIYPAYRLTSSLASNFNTSSCVGKPACAPSFVVVNAAAALAHAPASDQERSSESATVSAAANASPAPVASTLFTGMMGNQYSCSDVMIRLPSS